MNGAAMASGSSPELVGERAATGEPCASMPTASITVGAPAAGRLAHDGGQVLLCSAQVDHLDAVLAGPLEPFRHQVDADHLLDAAVRGDPGGHVADRAQPEHREGPAGRIGVGDGLPGRGEHVGQVDEPVVRRAPRAP